MSQYPAPYDPYEPKPPARSTGSTVGGVVFGAIAAIFALGLLSSLATGHMHAGSGMHLVGWLLGVLICVGIPAFASYRLLGSHKRDVKAWQEALDEERRQRQLRGGL